MSAPPPVQQRTRTLSLDEFCANASRQFQHWEFLGGEGTGETVPEQCRDMIASTPGKMVLGSEKSLLKINSKNKLEAFFAWIKGLRVFSLETLDLTHTEFTEETWECFVDNLHLLQGTRELKLPRLDVAALLRLNQGAPLFFSALTKLTVSGKNNTDYDDFFSDSNSFLANLEVIEELTLSNLGIVEDDVYVLELIPNEHLKKLKLPHNDIVDEDLEGILPYLEKCLQLTELDLSGNALRCSSPSFINWLSKADPLRILDLRNNNIIVMLTVPDWLGELGSAEKPLQVTMHIIPQFDQLLTDGINELLIQKLENVGVTVPYTNPRRCDSPIPIGIAYPVDGVQREGNVVEDYFGGVEWSRPQRTPWQEFTAESVPELLTQEWLDRVNRFLQDPIIRNEVLEWALSFQNTITDVGYDGDCLFSAAAKQCGVESSYLMRLLAVQHMENHYEDFFIYCLPDEGDDQSETFEGRLLRMSKPAEWGEQPEVAALGGLLQLPTVAFNPQANLVLSETGKLLPPPMYVSDGYQGNHRALFFINRVDGYGRGMHWKAVRPKTGDAIELPQFLQEVQDDSIGKLLSDENVSPEAALVRWWRLSQALSGKRISIENTRITSVTALKALYYLFYAKHDKGLSELHFENVQFSPECWTELLTNGNKMVALQSLSFTGITQQQIQDLGERGKRLVKDLGRLSIINSRIEDVEAFCTTLTQLFREANVKSFTLNNCGLTAIPFTADVFSGTEIPSLDLSGNQLPENVVKELIDQVLVQRQAPCCFRPSFIIGEQEGITFSDEGKAAMGAKLALMGVRSDFPKGGDITVEGVSDERLDLINEIVRTTTISPDLIGKVNAYKGQDRRWGIILLLKKLFHFSQTKVDHKDLVAVIEAARICKKKDLEKAVAEMLKQDNIHFSSPDTFTLADNISKLSELSKDDMQRILRNVGLPTVIFEDGDTFNIIHLYLETLLVNQTTELLPGQTKVHYFYRDSEGRFYRLKQLPPPRGG